MFRVVLIGATEVGKTSIHKRIAHDQFDEHVAPTAGGQSFVHSEPCGNFGTRSLLIWDTAGQERFRAIAPIYYRDAQAAIAVFSVTSAISLTDLPEWIEAFQKVAGSEAIISIVANKMDLPAHADIDLAAAERDAAAHGYLFFKTSARTGEGVADSVHEMAMEICRRALEPKGKVESAMIPEKSECC
jgi:small GTP-binding protein